MASTAFFKFIGIKDGSGNDVDVPVDEVPTELTADITSATFKTQLAKLYDNKGGDAICGPGKFIFGNADDGIEAPVIQVVTCIKQFTDLDDNTVDAQLLFHLRNVSDLFRVS